MQASEQAQQAGALPGVPEHGPGSRPAGAQHEAQHTTHSMQPSSSAPAEQAGSVSGQTSAQQLQAPGVGSGKPGSRGSAGGKMQWLTRSDLDGLSKKPLGIVEEAIADAAVDVPEVTQVGGTAELHGRAAYSEIMAHQHACCMQPLHVSDTHPTLTPPHPHPHPQVRWVPWKSCWLTAADDDLLRMWSPAGELLSSFRYHGGSCQHLAVDPANEVVLVAAADCTVYCYSLDDPVPLGGCLLGLGWGDLDTHTTMLLPLQVVTNAGLAALPAATAATAASVSLPTTAHVSFANHC